MRYTIIPLLLLGIAFSATAQESNSDLALAEAYYAQGDWKNAARSYDLVIREDTEAPFVLQKLSYSLMKMRHEDRARIVLDRLIELQPDNEVAHFNLGLLYWRTQRPLMAIPCFEAAC
ncbi:MAG: hypothetical protein C0600_05710 [Ignavibacteria bacterium]|nr:MAG: hypothetical protein C0600_05710 [Ignavibacteria bacterium]